jgi:hypothetical protein
LIDALRDFAVFQEREPMRRIAKPRDEVIPKAVLDVRPYLKDEVAKASFYVRLWEVGCCLQGAGDMTAGAVACSVC